MYSVFDYGGMILDSVRMEAYAAALKQAITPNSVVLDIGTGTGILALLACQYGARHIYAIDVNEAIEVAKEIAAQNGLGDRITFYQASSLEVDLPERVDVIVSDIRGTVPLMEQHIPIIKDARRRFLALGGTLIPQQDTLCVACVETPDIYAKFDAPWQTDRFGFDMRAARKIVTNSIRKEKVEAGQLLTESSSFAVLDYQTIESPHVSAAINLQVTRSGTAHGLSLWFEAQIAQGISYTTAPAAPEMIYGEGFLPLEAPVPVNAGEVIRVKLQANLVGDDYIWSWDTEFPDGTHFKQSTFYSIPLSLDMLRKSAPTHTPNLNVKGECVLLAINLMSQQTPLQQIANALLEHFPRQFLDEQDALDFVRKLAQKYAS
jgi:protein arginine N-methyltransferase 1